MTISATGAVATGTALPAASTSQSQRPDALGKDAFLSLLVAQLKYQDPMNPADGTEFIAQTAQFTMVEKLEQLTSQNAELLAANRLLGAGSLVGRKVSYLDAEGTEVTGTVSAARLYQDGTLLTVDGKDIPLAHVSSITAP